MCGALTVPLRRTTGVEGSFARRHEPVHPPLGGGAGVQLAAGRRERLGGGPENLVGNRVAARAGQHAGVVQGQPEGQVAFLPPALLTVLSRPGIRAVGDFASELP